MFQLLLFPGISLTRSHPLKGTCQEKKIFCKQEETLFLGGGCDCEHWQAFGSLGNHYLIDSLVLFSMVFSVSVLTAPIAHQDGGLHKVQPSSVAPSVSIGLEDFRSQVAAKWGLSALRVVSQFPVVHDVGGQDADGLVGWGRNG